MSGFTGPKTMDGLLENASKGLKSLEHDKKFPKDKIQHCNGIVLLHSMELGLFVSGQDASGVLLARKDDGTWSAPLAVAMTGVGVGSLGFAEKETIMVLNQAAVDSFTGGIPIKFGADAGLTNYIGGEVGADAGIGKAGLESSYAFSNSEGGIVSLEIHSCIIKPKDTINRAFYPDKMDADVLAGNVDIKDGSQVAQLMAHVSALTAGAVSTAK